MPLHPAQSSPPASPSTRSGKAGYAIRPLLVIFGILALLAGLIIAFQNSEFLIPTYAAILAFAIGAAIIIAGSCNWLKRIDGHLLLRTDEKLQNKDALVIITSAFLAMHLGLCVASAGAAVLFPQEGSAHPAAFLAIIAALSATAVGGAFGFLLGHPRRLADDAAAQDGRTGSNWLLKTGLDDIVDWLVKGITTVLLVDSKLILKQLEPLAKSVGAGIAGSSVDNLSQQGYTFALALLVYFTIFGAGATCLVTRTYLTGALGRADRSTVNAFSRVGLDWGEILTLVGAQRFLGSRNGEATSEILNVARKLAALSLSDLNKTQEYALWAKAKSALGTPEDIQQALKGYEKTILQCDCDPALLLDYAVTLNQANDRSGAITRLEQARLQISQATPSEVSKNIYKSLTFALLYHANHHERVLNLVNEYFARPGAVPSGGLRVNEVCAYAQKFQTSASAYGFLPPRGEDGILRVVPNDRTTWPEEMRFTFNAALLGIESALKQDPDWVRRFLELFVHATEGKQPNEDDLEVFEAFPSFRLLLGLPPLPPTVAPGDDGPPNDTPVAPVENSPPAVVTSAPPSQSAAHPNLPSESAPSTQTPDS